MTKWRSCLLSFPLESKIQINKRSSKKGKNETRDNFHLLKNHFRPIYNHFRLINNFRLIKNRWSAGGLKKKNSRHGIKINRPIRFPQNLNPKPRKKVKSEPFLSGCLVWKQSKANTKGPRLAAYMVMMTVKRSADEIFLPKISLQRQILLLF